SCHFPNDKAHAQYFAHDPESLREMAAMLLLAEHDDTRNVLEATSYSRNSDEARVQAVLAVLRILGVTDNGLIGKLSGMEFAKKWNELSIGLISGSLTGMRRTPHKILIENTSRRIGSLAPRSKAILREYIKRSLQHDIAKQRLAFL